MSSAARIFICKTAIDISSDLTASFGRCVFPIAKRRKMRYNKIMTSSQRKILSSAASNLNPLVIVGQGGMTEGVVQKIAKVLDDHELIKVKFNEFKEEKKDLTAELCAQTGAELVRIIGNVAILYKESTNPDKRKHLI